MSAIDVLVDEIRVYLCSHGWKDSGEVSVSGRLYIGPHDNIPRSPASAFLHELNLALDARMPKPPK